MNALTGLYPLVIANEAREALSTLTSASRPRDSSIILQRAHQIADTAVGVQPLLRLADVLVRTDKPRDALPIFDEALGMITRTYGRGDAVVADVLLGKGRALQRLGEHLAARGLYEEALEVLESLDPEGAGLADVLAHLATAHAALGEPWDAEQRVEQALAVFGRKTRPDEVTEASVRRVVWLRLGDSALTAGRRDDARRLYERARLRARTGEAVFLARLGGLVAAEGHARAAVDQLRASLRLFTDEGMLDPFWTLVREAALPGRNTEQPDAFDEAFRILRKDQAVQEHLGTFRPELSAVLPNQWLAKESITLQAPDGQANVIASSEPLDREMTSEHYAASQGEVLRKDFPGFQERSFEEVTVLEDRRGFLREFTWSPPDGVEVAQMQFYYTEDGRGYTATATTAASHFPDVKVELRQILMGLKIRS
jgi:tetratricopeptide (TPR) repeat protein